MEAVHRYEGMVNQAMGDGIMALFGAPLAHEDHAVRACYTALRMQESVKRYAEGVRRQHGVEIRIRVGLNSKGATTQGSGVPKRRLGFRGNSNGLLAPPRRPRPPQPPPSPAPPAGTACSPAVRAFGWCWTGAAACGRVEPLGCRAWESRFQTGWQTLSSVRYPVTARTAPTRPRAPA
jgi:hypothetical protein